MALPQPSTIPPVAKPEGIDISKWDVSFNPKIATAKIDFVFQRVSYGVPSGAVFKDPKFEAFLPGVQAIPVRGAYHYLSSYVNYKKQADSFLEIVDGKGYHIYVCDFEEIFNEMSQAFAAMAIEWCRYVKAATKKPVMIYSNRSKWQDYLGKDSRSKEFPFWYAWPLAPVPNPQTANPIMPSGPYGRKDWTVWQYSFGEHNDLGTARGVGRAGVDVDVFNGSLSDLWKFAGIESTSIPPEQSFDSMTVDEKITILAREVKLLGGNLNK